MTRPRGRGGPRSGGATAGGEGRGRGDNNERGRGRGNNPYVPPGGRDQSTRARGSARGGLNNNSPRGGNISRGRGRGKDNQQVGNAFHLNARSQQSASSSQLRSASQFPGDSSESQPMQRTKSNESNSSQQSNNSQKSGSPRNSFGSGDEQSTSRNSLQGLAPDEEERRKVRALRFAPKGSVDQTRKNPSPFTQPGSSDQRPASRSGFPQSGFSGQQQKPNTPFTQSGFGSEQQKPNNAFGQPTFGIAQEKESSPFAQFGAGNDAQKNTTPFSGPSFGGQKQTGINFFAQSGFENEPQKGIGSVGQRGFGNAQPKGAGSFEQTGFVNTQQKGSSPLAQTGFGHLKQTSSSSASHSSPPRLAKLQSTANIPKSDYAKRYEYLKSQRPKEIAKAVAAKKMADPDPDVKVSLEGAINIVGECEDMCPEYERLRRIVQDDVMPLECDPSTLGGKRWDRVPDEARMIKKFRRSAAGVEPQIPSDLRPPRTLMKTVEYMFGPLLDQTDFTTANAFLWDRSRAIRNDFSIQDSRKPEDLRVQKDVYVRIARFHVLSIHQMTRTDVTIPDTYSQQQDVEQFKNTMHTLKEIMGSEKIKASSDEGEIAAYDIVFGMVVGQEQRGFEMYPAYVQEHPTFQAAYRIMRAGTMGFFNEIRSPATPYLLACAAEYHFNNVRHAMIKRLVTTYRQGGPNRIEDWSIADATTALAFDTADETEAFCKHYGLSFKNSADGTRFLDFNKAPRNGLDKVHIWTKSAFSKNLVEAKRHGQSWSDLISGTEAPSLPAPIPTASSIPLEEADDSLFVPETPFNAVGSSAFGLPSSGKLDASVSPFKPADHVFQAGRQEESQSSPKPPLDPVFGKPVVFPPAASPFQFPKAAGITSPAYPVSLPTQEVPAAAPAAVLQPDAAHLEEQRRKEQLDQEKAAALEEQRRQEELQRQKAAAEAEAQKREEMRLLLQQREEEARQEALRLQRLREEELQQQRILEQQRQQEQLRQLQLLQEQQAALEAQRRQEHIQQQKDTAMGKLAQNVVLQASQTNRYRSEDGKTGLLFDIVEVTVEDIFNDVKSQMDLEKADDFIRQHLVKKVYAFWRQKAHAKRLRSHGQRRRQQIAQGDFGHSVLGPQPKMSNTTVSSFQEDAGRMNAAGDSDTSRHSITRQAQRKTSKAPKTRVKVSNPPNATVPTRSATGSSPEPRMKKSLLGTMYNDPNERLDRTQTDWFKLRAQGIDPSTRRRKRSAEVNPKDNAVTGHQRQGSNDQKRLCTSLTSRTTPLPPPADDEERFARIRAVLQKSKQTSTPPQRISFTPRQSYGKAITQAKALDSDNHPVLQPACERHRIFDETEAFSPEETENLHINDSAEKKSVSSASKATPPTTSTFSRSLPVLNKFTSKASNVNVPAYRLRTSRFIPKELYGKGREAVRDFRASLKPKGVTKSTFITKQRQARQGPLMLSSPFPAQQSFVSQAQSQVNNDDDFSLYEDENGQLLSATDQDEDGDAEMSGEDEEYDDDDDDDDVEDQEEQEYEENDEEDQRTRASNWSVGSRFNAGAQEEEKGASVDDAIELSD
ncbi:hypothetical protein GQ43DRAFT_476009 [Delitschia confertaspora ATCC 74209]|uniref:SAC3/GANP/THP3 conserved domain-containing protein n=1 Tax=Delitschia confertaspora ATCC 74209 TaxID=1513339 RepID=A0A9P4MN63_9PLEO|nr:hypothetical protein GQ43DRAFT_476009 [Delitschia confertaspora ATCC 74209]